MQDWSNRPQAGSLFVGSPRYLFGTPVGKEMATLHPFKSGSNSIQRVVSRAGVARFPLACAAVLILASTFTLGRPNPARAQQNSYGRIVGTVKDASGASVAGAEVHLIHSQNAVLRAVLTDANGKFTLDNITAGSYELKVTRIGFGDFRSAVQVKANAVKELQ